MTANCPRSVNAGDVITFHGSLQVPGRADDPRGMDMIVAEEVPYLKGAFGCHFPAVRPTISGTDVTEEAPMSGGGWPSSADAANHMRG